MHPLRRVLASLTRPHYLYRPYQLFLRLARTAAPPSKPIQRVPLPWGIDLTIDIGEHIGRAVWRHGLYALTVSEALWRLTDPGATAVDAGANIGHMTSILALRAGPRGRVLAFEPHPVVFQRLQGNLRAFASRPDLAPVAAFAKALSNRTGTAELAWNDTFAQNQGTAQVGGAGPHHATVPRCTLDDVCADGVVSVLKLDVEGHELAALQGSHRMLREGRVPHVVYECTSGAHARVHAFLEAHGFSTYRLSWRRRGPALLPRTRRPSAPPYSNYLATRRPVEVRRRFARRGWCTLRPTGS